jgi:hypothetical protein
MSNDKIINCLVCYTPTVDSKDGRCSTKCRQTEQVVDFFSKEILEYNDQDDTRVYFYDIGLGALVDMYTINIIKFVRSDTFKQSEIKYYLDKIQDAILTKINRSAKNQFIRKHIIEKMKKLLVINYKMWMARDSFFKDQETLGSAVVYLEYTKERDSLKNEIDLAVEGRARINRLYV